MPADNTLQMLEYTYFWATVCKTVRPMLSARFLSVCLSVCLSVLSVTQVYCDQTVEWIKMKRSTQVGLYPDHIVLDGDKTHPPQRGTTLQCGPISVVAK